MTTKANAIVLARTARSEAANTAKRTIAAIISNWNECVEQSGFTGIFDFPTIGYTRKAQLIADLERCAAQLEDYVEPNPHAAQTVEQQIREFNAALTRVLDVEEAHAEALDINRWIDDLTTGGVASKKLDTFCFQVRENDHTEALEIDAILNDHNKEIDQLGFLLNAPAQRRKMIEDAHAEALIENDEFDGIIRDGLTLEQRAIHIRRQGIDIYGERFAEMYDRDYAEALEMNVGIELALHIITKLAKPGEVVEAGDAAGGCLYRDGFNEINYLVSMALSMYSRREKAHAEALEINAAMDDAAKRWSRPGAKSNEHLHLSIADAHSEALEINDLVSIGNDIPHFMPHLIIKRRNGGYALHVSDMRPKTTRNPLAASFWDVMPGDPISEREERSKMRQFMREGDTITSIGDAIKETMIFALGPNWIGIVRRWSNEKSGLVNSTCN